MIQIDEHIFQMGWLNHQLVMLVFKGGNFAFCNTSPHAEIRVSTGIIYIHTLVPT